MPRPIGVYIHFPFCAARCPYCDFATAAVSSIPHRAYADAVIADVRGQIEGGAWSGREVASVYFGGGTPSLWEPRQLGRVIEALRALLPFERAPEVTCEVNPGPVESAALPELRAAGVNRLSFGTQSFQQAFLSALGRRHGEADSESAVARARAAGFENVTVDLIYACPGQDASAAAEDAKRALASGADHVSAYCLTLHGGVPMERSVEAGLTILPGEDEAVEIEEAVMERLAAGGLERYEISNFARAGRQSRHNVGYWTGREYLAAGASAHGFRLNGPNARAGGVRYRNLPTRLYMERASTSGPFVEEREPLPPRAILQESLFLGLRMLDGVCVRSLAEHTGLDPTSVYAAEIDRLEREGLIALEGGVIRPTDRGLRFNDTLAARF